MATDRILPQWPATAAAWKPGTSALSMVARVGPMRSAVWPQPEPEDEGHVVGRRSGALGDDGGGGLGDVEGVGTRVVEIHAHARTLQWRSGPTAPMVGWRRDGAPHVGRRPRRRPGRVRGRAGRRAARGLRHRGRPRRPRRRLRAHRLRTEQGPHLDGRVRHEPRHRRRPRGRPGRRERRPRHRQPPDPRPRGGPEPRHRGAPHRRRRADRPRHRHAARRPARCGPWVSTELPRSSTPRWCWSRPVRRRAPCRPRSRTASGS